MVIGHSSMPDIIQFWIFSFHMPLFFILSGMMSKWGKISFLQFFIRKLIVLGRPFIIYSALCAFIIHTLKLGSFSFAKGWGDFALWFVPVLFFALLVAKGVLNCGKKHKIALIILLPFVSGVLRFYDIRLPWNLSVVPYASFLVILGGLSKGKTASLNWMNRWLLALFFVLTLLVSHWFHLDMSRNQCLPVIPLTIGAVAGTLFICGVSKIIDLICGRLSRILQSVGRETFIILSFSQVFIMSINKYLMLNTVVKYVLLVVALVGVKYVKDLVVDNYISIPKNRKS